MMVVYLDKQNAVFLAQHLKSKCSELLFYKIKALGARQNLKGVVLYNMEKQQETISFPQATQL
jgi:hypothetical protein